MAGLSLDLSAQLNIMYVARYLILVAVVILVQHYVTSFQKEQRYIWNAPPSFAKYSFLLSRHIPIICGAFIFIPLSGFLGYTMTDKACGWLICTAVLCISMSLMLNNILAAFYIGSLWNHKRTLLRGLFVVFTLAYATTAVAIFLGLAHMKAGMVWMPLINSCIVTSFDPMMIVTAAAPLGFELTMLAALCWNAFDRPRSTSVSLRQALADDGVIFFLCTAIFRAIQLALVVTRHPGIAMIGLLSVSLTCILSIVFNQRAFLRQAAAPGLDERARMPLSTLPLNFLLPRRPANPLDKPQWFPGAEVELGRVDIELHQDL